MTYYSYVYIDNVRIFFYMKQKICEKTSKIHGKDFSYIAEKSQRRHYSWWNIFHVGRRRLNEIAIISSVIFYLFRREGVFFLLQYFHFQQAANQTSCFSDKEEFESARESSIVWMRKAFVICECMEFRHKKYWVYIII